VELVHPRVVAAFAAAGATHVTELRKRLGVEAPALRAVLTGRAGTVERAAALAPIEARHMTAGQRRPVHAVAIHVTAAWGEPDVRHGGVVPRMLIDLGQRRVRRVRAGIEAEDRAGETEQRAPDRTVG